MGGSCDGSCRLVSLRRVTPADLEFMYQIGLDPGANAMAGTKPRTREAFFAAWEGHVLNPAVHGCVIECDRVVVGSIACFQVEGSDHVGYWVVREQWGRGIASCALRAFLEREQRRPLHATASVENGASIRILERCGFRCTGRRWGEETERFLKREVASFVLE